MVAAVAARGAVGDHSTPIRVDYEGWIFDIAVPLVGIVRLAVAVGVEVIHHALEPRPVHAAALRELDQHPTALSGSSHDGADREKVERPAGGVGVVAGGVCALEIRAEGFVDHFCHFIWPGGVCVRRDHPNHEALPVQVWLRHSVIWVHRGLKLPRVHAAVWVARRGHWHARRLIEGRLAPPNVDWWRGA